MIAAQVAAGQSTCACTDPNSAWLTDSTIVNLSFRGYSHEGLKGREWRLMDKCLGFGTRNPLVLDAAFRKKLCTCVLERVCFTRMEMVPATKKLPPVLYFYYEER